MVVSVASQSGLALSVAVPLVILALIVAPYTCNWVCIGSLFVQGFGLHLFRLE